MSQRIMGIIPDELEEGVQALYDEGYTQAEIVREGTRLLIQKKKWERILLEQDEREVLKRREAGLA